MRTTTIIQHRANRVAKITTITIIILNDWIGVFDCRVLVAKVSLVETTVGLLISWRSVSILKADNHYSSL